jgi:hypothetical protein
MITRRGNTSTLGWCRNLPCRKNKSKKQRKKIHLIPFSRYHQSIISTWFIPNILSPTLLIKARAATQKKIDLKT